MATLSPSNSENSATQQTNQDGAPSSITGVTDTKFELLPDSLQDLETSEYIEKYRKYEADYTRRLKEKYFSKKNIYGGDIFEEKVIINGETIKSSRWPCTRSYADPVQFMEDQNNLSAHTAETSSNVSNGKHQVKKHS